MKKIRERKFVPIEDLEDLRPGDVVRGKDTGITYMVVANYGIRVTAIKEVDITHPPEWEVLR